MSPDANNKLAAASLNAMFAYARSGYSSHATVQFLVSQVYYVRAGNEFVGNAKHIDESFKGEWRHGQRSGAWREI